MKLDMNRTLIETAIRRALRGMETDPERSIRNLIDLGLTFAKGPAQQNFLRAVRDRLGRPDSAYYGLLRDVLQNVDHQRLTALGLALGYNSCTRGAARIRSIEAAQGFNIPWLLSLAADGDRLPFYSGLMDQGTALGIFTYALFPQGDPAALLPLAGSHPDCACLLFLPADRVDGGLLRALERAENVLPAVEDGAERMAACSLLRSAKLPYALWRRYGAADLEELRSGRWLEHILPAHPLLALLLPAADCPQAVREAVYAAVLAQRTGQRHPLVPVEILRDGLMIDEIISDDGCLVGFDQAGALYTHLGPCPGAEYGLFQNSLEDILRRVQALR